MDLPTCPACGQSVLDDEAEDCPFCGSSMSGTPVATATKSGSATKPAASTQPSKQASQKPAAKRRTAPEPPPEDDDPFGMSAPSNTKAVQLRAKPEKGRRHQVICPMCETKGYTSRKAAGMEVRCANPDCLIPVFTAPVIEEPKTEDENAETETAAPWWKSPANLAAVGAMLAVVGIGIWYFGFREGPPKKNLSGNPYEGLDDDPIKTKTKQPEVVGTKDPPVVVKQESLPELRDKAFRIMEQTIGSGELSDTLRPASFQAVADAYAQAGDAKKADDYIDRLANVASNVPFYTVRPLAEDAWQELKRDPENGPAKAKLLLSKASAAADSLVRQTSRIRQDTVSVLAAGLFAVGEKDAARKLIETHADKGETGRTSLALLTALHGGGYDIHATLLNAPLVDPTASQHVAVTRILVFRGRSDAALDWAQQQTNDVAKRECLLAWAEWDAARLFMQQRPLAPDEKDPLAEQWNAIENVIAKLPAVAQTSAYARIAVRAKNEKSATAWLEKARAAMKTLPSPKPMPLPNAQQVFVTATPSASNKKAYRLAAVAAVELARAENHWNKQAGWKNLSQGLDYARSLAPSPTGIHELAQQATGDGLSDLKQKLAAEFNLDDNDRVNTKVREYSRKCAELQVDADNRFRFQFGLLEWAIDWSSQELAADIWKEVSGRVDPTRKAGEREPYADTRKFAVRVPWMLATRFVGWGDQKTAGKIRGDMRAGNHTATPRQESLDEAADQIAAGNFALAAAPFNRLRSDSVWRRQRAMAVACGIVKRHGIDAAYQFVARIDGRIDPYLRFDAFDLIGSLATHTGHGREAWKIIADTSHPAADRVAFCHGFVVAVAGAADEPPQGTTSKTAASVSPQ